MVTVMGPTVPLTAIKASVVDWTPGAERSRTQAHGRGRSALRTSIGEGKHQAASRSLIARAG